MIEEFEAALSLLPPGKLGIFVDIGAHYGEWSIEAARRFEIVHAVEPHPVTFAALIRATAGFANVHRYRVAISDHYGDEPLYDDCPSTVVSLEPKWRTDTFPQYYRSDRAVTVAVEPWSAFMARIGFPVIDLVKIDAEGCDARIFSGICRGPLARPKVVVLEVNRPDIAGVEESATLGGYRLAREFTLDGERGHFNRVYTR